MSMIAAHAAWHMGHWEAMATYVDTVDSADTPQSQTAAGAFLRAALCVKEDAFDLAKVRGGRGGGAWPTRRRARPLRGPSYGLLCV